MVIFTPPSTTRLNVGWVGEQQHNAIACVFRVVIDADHLRDVDNVGGNARRSNLSQQRFTYRIRRNFIADDDNAGNVGFFGPAGGDLTMN